MSVNSGSGELQNYYMYNNENLGWDDKYVQQFFDATKIKTV